MGNAKNVTIEFYKKNVTIDSDLIHGTRLNTV
jgi:hypothetical protein